MNTRRTYSFTPCRCRGPQVERRHGRHVEKQRVLGAASTARARTRVAPARRARRGGRTPRTAPRDVLLGPRPERRRLLTVSSSSVTRYAAGPDPRLLAHQDRQRDVIGVFADDRRQPPARQELFVSSRRCSVTSVPRAGRSMRSIVYSPPPPTPSARPRSRQPRAARDQSHRSATMNEE